MKVVFLCGGTSKRMHPVTRDKFLLEFAGKTLLEHQIDRARQAGLNDLVVVGNPQNIERIKQTVARISGASVGLAVQKEPRGIADALESAAEHLTGEFILVNPNDVFETSAYGDVLAAREATGACSYIAAHEVSDYFPGGYLVVDADNNLKHIVEKPGAGREPGLLVNFMVHLHTAPDRLLDAIREVKSETDDVYERALDRLAQRYPVKVVVCRGFWQAIKYPWHILPVARYFLDTVPAEIATTAEVSARATLDGKVWLGDKVRVLENAILKGPLYVGPNSVIGNNALVRDYSHVGSGCVIGFGSEIKATYIGNNCSFHSNYIGDSVIGDNCSFGAGTMVANLRLDERDIIADLKGETLNTGRTKLGIIVGDNCRFGIHVSTTPGIRVGPDSFIGPHVYLTRDVEAGKTAIARPNYLTIDSATVGRREVA